MDRLSLSSKNPKSLNFLQNLNKTPSKHLRSSSVWSQPTYSGSLLNKGESCSLLCGHPEIPPRPAACLYPTPVHTNARPLGTRQKESVGDAGSVRTRKKQAILAAQCPKILGVGIRVSITPWMRMEEPISSFFEKKVTNLP